MSTERQALAQYLVSELTESKSAEHNSWLDLETPEHKARVVRALIALETMSMAERC